MTWLHHRHDVKIPKVLHNCPIVEAVVDFQFESTIPDAAVFGAIYNKVGSLLSGQVSALPITQLPEQLRINDPSLRVSPHYRIIEKNRLLQIGPHTLNFIMTFPYEGWGDFSSWIEGICKLADSSNIVKKIDRVGVRFINAFEGNALPYVKLQSLYMGEQFPSEDTSTSHLFTEEDIHHRIHISTPKNVRMGMKSFTGTILDIDTFKGVSLGSFADAFAVADKIHMEEKKTFFSLIEDSFLQNFKPEY